MFGALLLYMIITVVLYATSSHVTSYQVTVGPLTKNPVCTGLALRKEQIVPAGASGYVEYYAREGMQVRKDGSVYALTNNKKRTQKCGAVGGAAGKNAFQYGEFFLWISGSDFYDAYSFKYELQGNILQAAGIMEQKTETEKKEEHTDSNAL